MQSFTRLTTLFSPEISLNYVPQSRQIDRYELATGRLYHSLHQFVLSGDPRSERYAAEDFGLIKNCLQDIEIPAPAAVQVCPHLLSEIELHFSMQIKRQFENSKPQVCCREQKRWPIGFSRCCMNMPVHVRDSSGARLREILPTNVFSLNEIWPPCQLLTLGWTPWNGRNLWLW